MGVLLQTLCLSEASFNAFRKTKLLENVILFL